MVKGISHGSSKPLFLVRIQVCLLNTELTMEQDELGWVSKNMEWAIIPYGKKFMTIYCGQQISVHNTMDTAKKFIQKEMKRK